MRSITIGFSKPHNRILPVFSWLIRWFDKTEFSHVYVKWTMKSGKPIIYQASGHQVNFIGNKRFELKNSVVKEFQFEIDELKFGKFLDWSVDESGAPYSVLLAIGMGISKALKLKKNFLGGKDMYVCSKIAGFFLATCVVEFNYNGNTSDMLTPKDIYKLCVGVQNDLSKN